MTTTQTTPIPRHPAWRPSRLTLAVGTPDIFAPCNLCGRMADIVHVGIIPTEDSGWYWDGYEDVRIPAYFGLEVCASCVDDGAENADDFDFPWEA